MFTTLFSLSLLLALVRSVLAQSKLMINTPTDVVQCRNTTITWTGSNDPPYDVLVVPADDVCGEALEDLGNTTSTYVNWTVNLASGTRFVLSLVDGDGNEAWSGNVTAGPSNDTSCLSSALGSTPSGTAPSGTATTHAPTSSAFSPVGAAGAGLVGTSGALSMNPLSDVTLIGSTVLAIVAFTI